MTLYIYNLFLKIDIFNELINGPEATDMGGTLKVLREETDEK